MITMNLPRVVRVATHDEPVHPCVPAVFLTRSLVTRRVSTGRATAAGYERCVKGLRVNVGYNHNA